MKTVWKWLKRLIVYPIVCIVLLVAFLMFLSDVFIKPEKDRDWTLDQKILSYAEIKDNLVTIHNIRNFTYASTTSYTPAYYDSTFDLTRLKKVWYMVEPFDSLPGSAHTLLSFEFEGDQFVAISVEIRKEKGESFNPIIGLFNQYELMYVIADERDVIKLRTNYRKDKVYLYPVDTTPEKARALFLSMVERANTLREHPEFYNTLTSTCITNIARHVNTITPRRVPLLNLRILFPATSDMLAYKLGLLDTDLPFEEARSKHYITERAQKYADAPDFSLRIRY
jgi:hypothetical protein